MEGNRPAQRVTVEYENQAVLCYSKRSLVGGRSDGVAGLESRMDEAAVQDLASSGV